MAAAPTTRDKLLEAAHGVLAEGGAVTVAEVCGRAGVNVAMVSYWFGGKDGLLDALADHVTTGVIEELDRLAALDLPPAERLRRHVAGVVRNYVDYPYVNQLSAERLSHGTTGTRFAELFVRPALAFYTELLAEGAARGDFREVDPTLFLFSVIGQCEFLFSARSWLEHGLGRPLDDETVERFVAHTVDLLLRGLTTDPR